MTTHESQPTYENQGYMSEYVAAFGTPAVQHEVEVDWNVRDVDPQLGVVRTVDEGDVSSRTYFADAVNRSFNRAR